ncbi:efflux RND transporter permease subunit [Pseudoalteromonas sp. S16_S37]|uniref:efflux RND transporter permease subunit n=1 Tax=Pseudoalteromonas sp. S16_S37 TaxID=2720228 RepID=UPI00167FE92D|nr:efflux RND transporter permease subunit [Pseudoalteromonas sp. S16_S37]MBD1584713.1 efflux RND transporter permease subunit [Pseudoalteromonas sp. S16_S37]
MSHFNLSVTPIVTEFSDKDTRESLESLKMALGLSLLLVFLVILYQFNNLYQSLLCIAVALFGIAGAVSSLYYFGSTLSLNSLLGILILIGLTVNNSILITDAFNYYRDQNIGSATAISQALRSRLVPLMVTNVTTIVGMLPLAIGFGAGQDILKPLGISVSGGLLVATVSTMFFVPVMLMFSRSDKTCRELEHPLSV